MGIEDQHIVQVGTTVVGVVADENIPLVNIALEPLDGVANLPDYGEDVHRYTGAHGQKLGLAVEKAAGEVSAGVDHGGTGGTQGYIRHFPHDRVQAVTDDLKRDGINVPDG